jgi:hypothetical protein
MDLQRVAECQVPVTATAPQSASHLTLYTLPLPHPRYEQFDSVSVIGGLLLAAGSDWATGGESNCVAGGMAMGGVKKSKIKGKGRASNDETDAPMQALVGLL